MDHAMLGKIVIALTKVPQYWGLLLDVIEKIPNNSFSCELAKFARKEPCWTNNGQVTQVAEPKPTPLILEPVSTVVIAATTGKFVAKNKFVVNTKCNAPVKISVVWDNFTSWFLSGDSKTEDPISEQTLRYHKLRESSVNGPIIAELGGAEKSETTLSEMFSLMEKQGKGEDGVLLNSGYANIFYIRDQNGVLRAVCVSWDGGGWNVDAGSVESPFRWSDGRHVFSRNSVLESSEPSAPMPTSLSVTTA
jgi:hypothetical protein